MSTGVAEVKQKHDIQNDIHFTTPAKMAVHTGRRLNGSRANITNCFIKKLICSIQKVATWPKGIAHQIPPLKSNYEIKIMVKLTDFRQSSTTMKLWTRDVTVQFQRSMPNKATSGKNISGPIFFKGAMSFPVPHEQEGHFLSRFFDTN